MDLQFNNLSDRVRYALRDFTSVGSKASFNVPVLSDETLYKMNPKRYSFYMQLLDALQDPKSEVLDRILAVETKTRLARETMDDRLSDMGKNLRYLQVRYNGRNKKKGGASSDALASFQKSIETYEKNANDEMKNILAIKQDLESIASELLDININRELDVDGRVNAVESVRAKFEDFKTKHPIEKIKEIANTSFNALKKIQDDAKTKLNTDIETTKNKLIDDINAHIDIYNDKISIMKGGTGPGGNDDNTTVSHEHVELKIQPHAAPEEATPKTAPGAVPAVTTEEATIEETASKAVPAVTPEKAASKAVPGEVKPGDAPGDAPKTTASEEEKIADVSSTAAAVTPTPSAKVDHLTDNIDKFVDLYDEINDKIASITKKTTELTTFGKKLADLNERYINFKNILNLKENIDATIASLMQVVKNDNLDTLNLAVEVTFSVEDLGQISMYSPPFHIDGKIDIESDGSNDNLPVTLPKHSGLLFELDLSKDDASLNRKTYTHAFDASFDAKKLTNRNLPILLSISDAKFRTSGFDNISNAKIDVPITKITPLTVEFGKAKTTLTLNPDFGRAHTIPLIIDISIKDATKNIMTTIEDIQKELSSALPPGAINVDNYKPTLTSAEEAKLADDALSAVIQKEANPNLAMYDVQLEPAKLGGAEAAALLMNGLFEGGAGKEEGSFYQQKIDEIAAVEGDKGLDNNPRERNKLLDNVLDEVETHPIYNPKFEQVSMTDRVVFIAVTFIIRALCLFLIDWGLNSHMINSFNRAFLLYIIIYMCIFLVWVLLVNAGEDGKNMFFRMVFYYVNWEVHGPGRVMVHLLIQLMLLPVPFVVKERVVGKNATWTYEQRRATYRVISNFTFFIWILTSIIALRY